VLAVRAPVIAAFGYSEYLAFALTHQTRLYFSTFLGGVDPMLWHLQPFFAELPPQLLVILLPSFERGQRLSVGGHDVLFIGSLSSALLAVKSFVGLLLDGAN
jgi:hypothetical protein